MAIWIWDGTTILVYVFKSVAGNGGKTGNVSDEVIAVYECVYQGVCFVWLPHCSHRHLTVFTPQNGGLRTELHDKCFAVILHMLNSWDTIALCMKGWEILCDLVNEATTCSDQADVERTPSTQTGHTAVTSHRVRKSLLLFWKHLFWIA